MAEIGSRWRRGALLAIVISWGCGPASTKTPDGAGPGAEGFGSASGAGGTSTLDATPVTPADHDIEVPPAP